MVSRDAPPRYHAYLVRCWQEQGQRVTDPSAWRCSLEDPYTGARRGFATFEALVSFLRDDLDDERGGATTATPTDEDIVCPRSLRLRLGCRSGAERDQSAWLGCRRSRETNPHGRMANHADCGRMKRPTHQIMSPDSTLAKKRGAWRA